MDEQNRSIDVTLNIPKEEHQQRPWSLAEIIRILVGGWKILAVCLAVFVAMGIVAAYYYLNSQTKSVPGGVWTLEYELSFPGIESGTGLDGKPYNKDEIKKASYIEEAIQKSGLDDMGITAADVTPRLTVQDILLPEVSRHMAAREELAKANISYKEFALSTVYYQDRFILTLRGDGPLENAGDSLGRFMEELLRVYHQNLIDMQPETSVEVNGKESSARDVMIRASGKASRIIEEDYPIALLEITQLLKSTRSELNSLSDQTTDDAKAVEAKDFAERLKNLQDQYITVLKREIEMGRLTRDRDALLIRLSSERAAAENQYIAAEEEARLLTELVAGTRQTAIQATHLVDLTREAVGNAAQAFERQNYYAYLIELYSAPEANLSSAVSAEQMYNNIIQEIQEIQYMHQVKEVQEVKAAIVAPVSFSVYPQPTANLSRVGLIIIGMASMGLFTGLLIVFGKRLYNRTNT